MGKKTVFSIIIPAFQVEDYLEQCIKSIVEQKTDLYEIILVDDGSTDRTPLLCDLYAETYENVYVIHQKNKGLSAARNRGIEMATGEYILFVDSDDFIVADSLGTLYNHLIAKNWPDITVFRRYSYEDKNLVECNYFFDENSLLQETISKQYRLIQNWKDCWLGAWVFCIKKDYVSNRRLYFYEGILHEDEEWAPRVFFSGGNISYCNIPIYCNRINRSSSICNQKNIKRLFDKLRIIDLLEEEFSKEKYSIDIKDTIRLRRQKILFGVINDAYLYKDNQLYEELKREIKKKVGLLKSSERALYCYIYLLIKGFRIDFIFVLLHLASRLIAKKK